MLKRISGKVAFIAAITWAVPVLACETDPFLFQLEGESKEDAKARSEAVGASFNIVGHYNRETYAFEKAERIYLAKIVSRLDGKVTEDKWTLPSTEVEPLKALKGGLPTKRIRLEGEGAGGMCSDVGDGTGAFASTGSLVVVFEGVPKSEYRPRGIDSFTTAEIRTIPLLDLLREAGTDLE